MIKKTTFNFTKLTLRKKVRNLFQIVAVALETTLPPRELEYLTELALLPEKFRHQRFSAKAKKIIIPDLISLYGDEKVSIASLNLRKYSLEDKKLVFKDEDGIYYFLDVIDKALDNIITAHVKQDPYLIEISL